VPDVSLIGSTSNFNLSGGGGGSEAITIAVAVSVIVLVCFCCCWYWCAFRAGLIRAGLLSVHLEEEYAKKNTAFVFAKPQANTPAVLEVIRTKFVELGIKVLKEGVVTGEEIDSKGFIDQHYYAIAEKSTLTAGKDLPVIPEKFKEAFGEDWSTVVAEGRALNALEFKNKFSAFQPEGALDKAWDATSAPGKRIKLGDGFYCGQIPVDGVEYYTFNAFFMKMRGKFTSPGSSIYYYVVEFDPATLSWADFRGKVLGPTNPADAPTDSLRGIVAANWQELGLQAPCDDSDNAVHASASPFESLAERTNWLACYVADDPFGSTLLAKGVPEAMIIEWFNDPQVKYDDETAKEKGKAKGSIFDALKELDYKQCLDRCVAINKASTLTAKGDQVEVKVEEVILSLPQEAELTDPRSVAEAQAIVGRRVLVQGLQQRKDLNGGSAKVIKWNVEASRWDIKMETTGNETVLVRSPNLAIIGGAGAPKTFMKTRLPKYASSANDYM
jgi:nucleoside diphosphate kinase